MESREQDLEQEDGCDSQTIRVLLMTNGFAGVYHQQISVTCKKEFEVSQNGKTKRYAANEIFRIKAGELKKGTCCITSGRGRLRVLSLTRQDGIPSYQGKLEIRKGKDGLLLINELLLRQYLYGVVPSEMNTSSPIEALKAQAICARSFAVRQIKQEGCREYHADMNDSTAYQVYNNIFSNRRAKRAVDETADQVVFYREQVASTYYFSTSCGMTASVEEVWGEEKIPYLQGSLQITEKSRKETGITSLDLSKEQVLKDFLQQTSCQTYDEESSWYRWSLFIGANELSARCNVGRVTKLQIVKREKSGTVTGLLVRGTEGKKKFDTADSIRQLLRPENYPVICSDETEVESLSMLPSACIWIQDGMNEDETGFFIYGGGFGHGVGMSQCGARKMAEEGWSCSDIIRHYFTGCEIKTVPIS